MARRERLKVLELHDDTENYRRNIAAWAANLEARREDLERSYGRYHVRRFQLYLWGSVQAFEHGDLQRHRLVLLTPGLV